MIQYCMQYICIFMTRLVSLFQYQHRTQIIAFFYWFFVCCLLAVCCFKVYCFAVVFKYKLFCWCWCDTTCNCCSNWRRRRASAIIRYALLFSFFFLLCFLLFAFCFLWRTPQNRNVSLWKWKPFAAAHDSTLTTRGGGPHAITATRLPTDVLNSDA